ncbi:prepilin-type N-terminal cleavage/methylation domain-containing protein [Geomonas sp. RF6]|uniref:PulJ/GspJ family protein n=1 Tax=Geomonas sp. RF6 TaxID=2897342 RepID=UPI001E4C5439|nr:prepilin-type N-terminal cleavage/methylation domain-containing protein [Geomonas sp. RF6]UFS69645.1 prepilin-type N-terminal cleavage/methylation domain-containing protein [Geomonas sp. RF6]
MCRDEGGYTLAELVVAIGVFAIVMTLTTLTFNRIVSTSSHLVRSEQTQIEGMIGLELLRIDLENAGLGLPWSYQTTGYAGYAEAQEGDNDPDAFNEAFDGTAGQFMAPRAVLVRRGTGTGIKGADYLVLKGAALGMSRVARRWSFLTYSSPLHAVVKPSRSESELYLGTDSGRVIALRDSVKNGVVSKELVMQGSLFSFPYSKPLPVAYLPKNPQDRLVVYGVDPDTATPLTRPFNRADYFISTPDDLPARCAKGTGRLSKMVLKQQGDASGSQFTVFPLLDCVADLQVVVGLDTNGDGDIDLHTDDLMNVNEFDPRTIREQVKEIRVYILAQEGGRDPSFLYPVPDAEKAIVVGDEAEAPEQTRERKASELSATFGGDWRHYRWKIFRIVVQPKNLE